jgi:hypothetical protein
MRVLVLTLAVLAVGCTIPQRIAAEINRTAWGRTTNAQTVEHYFDAKPGEQLAHARQGHVWFDTIGPGTWMNYPDWQWMTIHEYAHTRGPLARPNYRATTSQANEERHAMCVARVITGRHYRGTLSQRAIEAGYWHCPDWANHIAWVWLRQTGQI